MRTIPSSSELIEIVVSFLREGTADANAFQFQVAANAIAIVGREIEIAPAADAAARSRLRLLLGIDGTAEDLERALAREIADGRVTATTAGVLDHLWKSTLAELSIDQPGYATYRRFVSIKEASLMTAPLATGPRPS